MALGFGQNLRRCRLVQLAGAMAIPPEDLVAGIHWTPGEARDGDFSFGTPRRSREVD